MRTPRLYVATAPSDGDRVTLPDDSRHYLQAVLRLKPGNPVVLFDGEDREYHCTILSLDRRKVVLTVNASRTRSLESPLHTTLIQSHSRGDRMDLTLQKAVELGVSEIRIAVTSRSTARLAPDRMAKRLAHWQGVVTSGCAQSHRNRLPEIHVASSLADAIANLCADCRLLLTPGSEGTLDRLAPPARGVALLVGPEGGFSEEEIRFAEAEGFLSVALGPRVLRTETAALVALSILQSKWGDLGCNQAHPASTL